MRLIQVMQTAVLCALILMAGAVTGAAEPRVRAATYDLNIPAQDLHTALQSLALAAHHKLFYKSDLVAGKTSQAVKGNHTVEEAIRTLLSGTDLTYEFTAAQALVIRARGAQGSGARKPAEQLRMALAAEAEKKDPDGVPGEKDTAQVVVEGQRERPAPFSTANVDLTRTEDDVLPFTVFTEQDIRQSGAMNLAEFFRARLSQNFQPGIPEEDYFNGRLDGAGSPPNAANALVLANGGGGGPGVGMGASELVILVDGRRLPNRTTGGNGLLGTQVTSGDFRGVPMASIERIEILTSAGSAIYGEGATGGVINIITRRGYQGGSLALGYESPMAAQAPRRSIDLSYALPLPWGASLQANYSYSRTDPLTVGDRADVTLARHRALIMERDPWRIMDPSLQLPLGATPNIRSVPIGTPLFGPGTSSVTSVPEGYAGGQGLTPFLSRQGQYNLDLADGNGRIDGYGIGTLLGPLQEYTTYSVGLDKSINAHWRATFEYHRQENRQTGRSGNELSLIVVPGTAPTNPFGQAVQVKWYDPRWEFDRTSEQATDRFLASLRGSFGGWRAILDLSHSIDTDNYRNELFVPRGGNLQPYVDSGVYNPFVDLRRVAAAPDSFYEDYNRKMDRSGGETRNNQAVFKVSGPVYTLPAGPIHLTGGLEWLHQKRVKGFSGQWTTNSITGELMGASLPGRLVDGVPTLIPNRGPLSDARTQSVYAEAVMPVLSSAQGFPVVNEADLFVSGRVSRQTVNGPRFLSSTTQVIPTAEDRFILTQPVYEMLEVETTPHLYAAGMRFAVPGGLDIRVSRSIGFKPPLFSQMLPSLPPTSQATVVDRRSETTVTLTPGMYISGGNPEIDPETTASSNIGLILQPRWLKGFRLSMDYTEGVRDTAITTLSPQGVLDLEAQDPRIASRVTRDAAGNITFVDARTINFNEILSRTATITVDQHIQDVGGGRLVLSGSATRNISFRVQTSTTTPPVEQIGNPTQSAAFSFVKWNANAQIRWERRQWTFGWSTRYFDEMLLRPTQVSFHGSDHLESALEHDALVAFRFEPRREGRMNSMLADLSVTMGIKNVFDRAPRYFVGSPLGYVSRDGVSGRSLWLQAGRSF